MKKILILFTLVATLIFATTSCHKYEDGGYASKNRLKGTWKVKEVTINGEKQPIEAIGGDFKFIFEKNGTGKFLIELAITPKWTFDWAFVDNKENLEIKNIKYEGTFQIPGIEAILLYIPDKCKILKLTKDDLWLKNTDSIPSIIKLTK